MASTYLEQILNKGIQRKVTGAYMPPGMMEAAFQGDIAARYREEGVARTEAAREAEAGRAFTLQEEQIAGRRSAERMQFGLEATALAGYGAYKLPGIVSGVKTGIQGIKDVFTPTIATTIGPTATGAEVADIGAGMGMQTYAPEAVGAITAATAASTAAYTAGAEAGAQTAAWLGGEAAIAEAGVATGPPGMVVAAAIIAAMIGFKMLKGGK